MDKQDSHSAARTCLIALVIFMALFLIICVVIALAISPLDFGSGDPSPTSSQQAVQTTGAASESLLVSVLDVDQGLSVAIVAPDGKAMLIDGGRSKERMDDEIVPYLRDLGVEELDYVVLTHPDQDHVGGLPRLLELMLVETFVDAVIPNTNQRYEETLGLVIDLEIEPVMARRNLELDLGQKVLVEILWPVDPLQLDGGDVAKNDNSIVIKITYGEVRFLITGDAERDAEMAMVDLDTGNELEAEILVVGHHGSNTSSAGLFLDAVSPEAAIISAGLDNQYGHPHDEVIQRLRFRTIDIYRTDLDGTVEIWTDGVNYNITPLGTEASK